MIVFTIPVVTRNPLNGSHGHWRKLAQMRKEQRGVSRLQTAVNLPRHSSIFDPCAVLLTRIAPSNGLDDDNLRAAMKSVRDGIADAFGVDDRDPRVTWQYAQERGKSYAVRVTIEAMPT